MQEIEKKAILEYFRNCKINDSKKELTIELSGCDNFNSDKIFIIQDEEKERGKEYFSHHDLEKFFQILSGEWVWRERTLILLEDITILDFEKQNEFLSNFYYLYLEKFDTNKVNKNFQTFLDYIKWGNNPLRAKIIRSINNYVYFQKSDKNLLQKDDLVELFFSSDKKEEGIVRVDFFGEDTFLDFFDKNNNEKFFICLEYVKIEKNKKFFLQPLYFIEVEIRENPDDHSFYMSISETSPTFNFYVDFKNGGKMQKLFNVEDKSENYDGINLKDDIDGEISFRSKIKLYKDAMSEEFEKDGIIYEPSLLSVNNLSMIQGLLTEYEKLLNDKNLDDLGENGLGIFFGESAKKKNYIEKFTNFTLLNHEQEIAVKSSLENNLSVIVGPPGTGKSQVVINILLNAYLNNKTVIFSSNNNTAVDTVIEKITKLSLSYLPFLRLWNAEKMNFWHTKIKENISKKIEANYIDFDNIEDKKEEIKNLNNEAKELEKSYLEYFQTYEDLELFLNNFSSELKEYIYKKKYIDINFSQLEKERNDYNSILMEYDKEKEKIDLQNIKIQRYKNDNQRLEKCFISLEEEKIQDVDFEKIIAKILQKADDTEKTKNENNIKKQNLNEKILENNYEEIFWKISEKLQKMSISGDFVNFENIKISDLKELISGINEAENYGFLKRVFGYKNSDLKRYRWEFLKIVESQKNENIRKYFFDFPDNIEENSELKGKILEMIYVHGLEDKMKNFKMFSEELSYFEEKSKKDMQILQEDFHDFITEQLENIFYTERTIKREEIVENINFIQEIFMKMNEFKKMLLTYQNLEKNFDKILANKMNFEKRMWEKFEEFDVEIVKNCIQKESGILENIDSLKKLESINLKRKKIDENFEKLKNFHKSMTEISEENFELQKILEQISLDYLSYNISEKINRKKSKIEDSIEKIYNYKSYWNEWRNGRDKYFKEKYTHIFWAINIFATTNFSTGNLPLEKWMFDYLIIDEASQNSIGDILPLLYRVKNVIIIGDPNQLENIISLNDCEIREIFYRTLSQKSLIFSEHSNSFEDLYHFWKNVYSVFEAISKTWFEQGVIALKQHFRCHDDIINYSNFIIQGYDLFPKVYGKNEVIENSAIPIGIHWQEDIRPMKIDIESKKNDSEAKAIARYLKDLVTILPNVSIGVIAPFRNQVENIRSEIRNIWLSWNENILVDTVHKFQGDEKDIILFSSVFPNCKASKFLNNENLLNVAVSRARSSFLIFGDYSAIKNYKWKDGEEMLYSTLVHYIDSIRKRNEKFEKQIFDTKYEKIFFEKLKNAGIIFDYQFPIYEGKYILDFRLKLKWSSFYINVELDGGAHDKRKSYDFTRNQKIEDLGYKVIRYSNSYLMENIDEIIYGFTKICECKR